MPLVLKVTMRQVDRAVDGLTGMRERSEDLSKPLGLLGKAIVTRTRSELAQGIHGIKTRHASEGLGASLNWRESPKALAVTTDKKYGASQQFGPEGGFYRSNRPGGYLAIPIGKNLNAKGEAIIQSPTDVSKEDGGFFFTSKKGNLLFARRIRKDRKLSKWMKRAKGELGEEVRGLQSRLNMLRNVKLLFALEEKVPGEAHMYCTFDERQDGPKWLRFLKGWLLQGR